MRETSPQVELDGWSVRVTGPHLPDGVVGHARMLYQSRLIGRAQGVHGWLLKALLHDKSKHWETIVPATGALRATWSERDFDLVRQTLAFLRRNTLGWAFEVGYSWRDAGDGAKRAQVLTVAVPMATYPRGVLMIVYATNGSPELINLETPGPNGQNALWPVTVVSPSSAAQDAR